ncbi:hypothetical protein D554_3231 [Bordetella holmesii 30539]|uniref:Uncharacterized protein n=2 Tax=Bordetella holmesii TaxID=35814 RepID=A0A158M319_9BORD|nr:hypothetical protein F783_003030 [Bordetella holmesii F627]EXF87955.1 hypothetical protein D554_3231 [Bordetella holmesii 30539]EXX93955.1 hypothetical protein D559_1363 [Bordetella holmesii 1058]KAK73087.1 hypothetical protein L573_1175 [Bordetella holmesii H620]KAK81107.1 hypothetical protein L503_1105 [Bordetella holmesii CDC-H809-BH]KAK88075.1 hypothetical protein L496_1086 [Bordetella holmesii CDC-H572-BH]KAK88322.1 hypothetical protein L497_2066 [Bordetella holmesii CDC-H585-BH]KAK9
MFYIAAAYKPAADPRAERQFSFIIRAIEALKPRGIQH